MTSGFTGTAVCAGDPAGPAVIAACRAAGLAAAAAGSAVAWWIRVRDRGARLRALTRTSGWCLAITGAGGCRSKPAATVEQHAGSGDGDVGEPTRVFTPPQCLL